MKKNVIQYRIKYHTTKSIGDRLDFCDLCTEFPWITPVRKLLRRSVERANIIDHIFNEGNNTRRRSNNINKRRDILIITRK